MIDKQYIYIYIYKLVYQLGYKTNKSGVGEGVRSDRERNKLIRVWEVIEFYIWRAEYGKN